MAAANGRLDWKIAWSVMWTESVQCCGRPSTCGSRKAPRLKTKTMIRAPTIEPRSTGTTTEKKVRSGEAPSIREASGSSGSRRESAG